MIHPSELLRTNSNEVRPFAAPRNEFDHNEFDCGLEKCPIFNRCCNLERYATPKVFLIFLSLVGFLQGVTLTYFRETSKLWSKHYHISRENIDWLIYTNEFFIGLVALVISYYGNKIHRISWIGALTIFLSLSGGLLLVPEAYVKGSMDVENLTEKFLCTSTIHGSIFSNRDINYIALIVLIFYLIIYAMASISFITLGLTYIDDNCHTTSPGYIGFALAAKELGKQLGIYLSYIPDHFSKKQIFLSPLWLVLSFLVFIVGIFVTMFPKSLLPTLVRTYSASLIDVATGRNFREKRKQTIDGFFKTVFRLLRNRILMVNIFSSVLLQSGLINFNIFEKYLKQARFQISEDNDYSNTQLTTGILKQPLVAISLIAVGLLLTKTTMRLQFLAKWNITVIAIVIMFFSSTAFLKCDPRTANEKLLTLETSKCRCQFEIFRPVCIKNTSYYSPCFAECQAFTQENFRITFTNCSENEQAIEGPCDEGSCIMYYALSQINNVFTSTLLASTLVTNVIINMRCILSKDKATALGLEATFIALIAYLPVKAIYGSVAENYCQKSEDGVCRLYSNNFAIFLSACTIAFMIASLILAILVWIFLKHYSLEDKQPDENSVVELDNLVIPATLNARREDTLDLSENKRQSDPGNSVSESLLEMENVGDDHDSVVSSLHDVQHRVTRNRLYESDF